MKSSKGVGFIVILALAMGLTALAAFAAEPQVKTASGAVSGAVLQKTQVAVFKGIPFAAPPVGDLRWRAPQPVKAWKGVRPATTLAASCMQNVHKEFLPWTDEFLVQNQASEDCLYLNVWTPKLSASAKLPVVVFIHGGGFTEGSGGVAVYDSEALAQTGLVMVTINYRLGAFGLLAHPELTAESEHHASGNYGLLDQIAALRWVQENIAGFGGDPHRVTIWGQSAGAFSVQDLIASPLAAGLFQRAMADSGIGIAGLPMPDLKSVEEAGLKFAASRHANSLQELRAVPAADLLPTAQEMGMRFMPNVDGWVLPSSPKQASKLGLDNDVPVLTGFQANDGMLFLPPMKSKEDFDQLVKMQYREFAAEFNRLYPTATIDDARAMLMESTRDRDRVSQFLWASRRAANHRQPVFIYFFDRAIPWPQHPEFGAFHSGELPYFFLNLHTLDRPWEAVDSTIAQYAAAYLKNFAAQADPSAPGLPVWKKVEAATPATMLIGAHTGASPVASPEKLAFWTRFLDSPAGVNAPPF